MRLGVADVSLGSVRAPGIGRGRRRSGAGRRRVLDSRRAHRVHAVNINVRRLILATVAAAILVIAAAISCSRSEREHWRANRAGVLDGSHACRKRDTSPTPARHRRFRGGGPDDCRHGPRRPVRRRRSWPSIGTTDDREIRGEVPWYGTLYNHASAAIAVVWRRGHRGHRRAKSAGPGGGGRYVSSWSRSSRAPGVLRC